MGADDLAVVGGLEPLGVALGGVDVEVVRPEIDHHLLELALGMDGVEDFVAGQLVEQFAGVVFQQFAERPGAEGFEAAGAGVGPVVVDGFRIELAGDELAGTERADFRMLAGAGAEGEAVEDVAGIVDFLRGGRLEGGESVGVTG